MESKMPKLRFPEFTNNWYEKSLSDLLTFKNGINASKEDYGSGYKFINVLDIINNDFITHEKILGSVNVSDDEFQTNIVEYGDILFQRSSETREEVGQANVYLDEEVPATFGGFVIRGKKRADYNPTFLNFLLKTDSVRKDITSKSGGSTRYNVGQDTLSSVLIKTTSIEEQTKIANFLTAINIRIKLLQKKKVELERYKKGVMQELFSQAIRFKEENGNNFPDWEMKKLGEVCDNVGGTALENYFSDKGSHNVISIGNYTTDGQFKANNQKILLNEKTKTKLLNKNDLVMVLNDKTATGDIIGSTILISEDNKFIYNQRSERLICIKDIVFPEYLWVYLNSSKFRKLVYSVSQGCTQIYVNFPVVKNLTLQLPCFIEQQKIASFLSSIDKSVNKIANQINDSVVYKQGLLKKLFV